jgi:hypothetical protein
MLKQFPEAFRSPYNCDVAFVDLCEETGFRENVVGLDYPPIARAFACLVLDVL